MRKILRFMQTPMIRNLSGVILTCTCACVWTLQANAGENKPDTSKTPQPQDTIKKTGLLSPDTTKKSSLSSQDTTRKPSLPSWVDKAIRLGLNSKVRPYPLSRKWLGLGEDEGSFTTPFLRVAIAAYEAKEKFKPFGKSDVTDEMIASVLVVTATPRFGEKIGGAHQGVEHIVIKKKGSNDPKDVIQPITTKPFDVTASTAGGATVMRQGLVANFPLNALQEGREFFFLYEEASDLLGSYPNKITFTIDQKMIEESMGLVVEQHH